MAFTTSSSSVSSSSLIIGDESIDRGTSWIDRGVNRKSSNEVSTVAVDHLPVQPPFPCLGCNRHFCRLKEWARHGCEVHHPELKAVCPHADCGRSFSRRYRLDQHRRGAHGELLVPHQLGQPPSSNNRLKIWGCGFCISYHMDWKDFSKHIWSHFLTGSIKKSWNTSKCIHSLLHFPSVRSDWHTLVGQYTNDDKHHVNQLRWSDSNVKELLEELEWDHTGRRPGPVLARKAFNLLDRINSFIPPVHSYTSLGFPYQGQESSSSMSIDPVLEGFDPSSPFQPMENLFMSSPPNDSSLLIAHHSRPLSGPDAMPAAIPQVGLLTGSGTGLDSSLERPQSAGDFDVGDFGWSESMSVPEFFDPGSNATSINGGSSYRWLNHSG